MVPVTRGDAIDGGVRSRRVSSASDRGCPIRPDDESFMNRAGYPVARYRWLMYTPTAAARLLAWSFNAEMAL